jgi:molecular chaperone DnaK
MGAVVGIDLGTTNTVVAAMQGGVPGAIKDETGSSLIPSIVSFLPSGAVMVGSTAKERRADDAKNTVYSIKRLIGRPWDSPEVRQARTRFSFELKEGPGRATFVVARNETFTLPEISAYVLRKAKSIAEIELGETVDRAVVTVPANFNDLQRAATKVAGRVAGLDVLRILNEPTAAALAYGYHEGNSEKIAVFDFGGGTFDITLLTLTQNVFEVLATAGNTFLGGDDLDWAIVEEMSNEFSAQFGLDVRNDPLALEVLRAAAETVKMRLGDATRAELDINLGPHVKGANSPLTFAMTRPEFERLATPIVDRAFDVCREALGVARIEIGDIDHVLLVGGCTRIPLVRRRTEEFFKRELDAHLDPHEVVAIGAALQAHALTTSKASSSQVEVPQVPAVRKVGEATDNRDDWRRKTHPFGRLGTTNVGLGQAQDSDQLEGIQVPKPDGAPSRPIPVTQSMGSRGRQNTAMGIGSDSPSPSAEPVAVMPQDPSGDSQASRPDKVAESPRFEIADELEPESLLPVVTTPGSTRHHGHSVRSAEPPSDEVGLKEPDDDEATVVRASAESVPDLDSDLPEVSAGPNVHSTSTSGSIERAEGGIQDSTSTADDFSLPAVQQKRPVSESRTPKSADADLPEVAATRGTSVRAARPSREPDIKRTSKPPSADELRQRYGDLPLIIGGRRLSSIPADRMPQPDDLPLVRPTSDTVDDAASLPDVQPERLPAIQRPRAPAPTIPDSTAHPDLPIVGMHTRPALTATEEPAIVSAPRKPPPPRAAPARAPVVPPVRSPTGDTPYSLSDSDLLEERSQPPSTGRISIRPAMRMDPGEEASLPLPNLPPKDGTGQVGTSTSQLPPLGNRTRTAVSSRPEKQRTQTESIDSTGFEETTQRRAIVAASTRPTGPKVAGLAAGLGATMSSVPKASAGGATAIRETHVQAETQASPLIPAMAPAPKPLRDAGLGVAPSARYGVTVPLLIDVTPLSLSVETVGAYCDILIDRNTPVPCERSREFVTVHDGQQTVRVRVAQGESRIFSENSLLGELELTGLRPAPRGQLRISVTFGLDSDGILHVRAIDLDTGRAATSELRLAGIPSQNEIAQMSSRQLANS